MYIHTYVWTNGHLRRTLTSTQKSRPKNDTEMDDWLTDINCRQQYLDMEKTSPWTLSWWELPMIQSVRYSTSLLRNFISCLNVRSSRLIIIASTSWHTFVFICIAWIVESRWRTYLTTRTFALFRVTVAQAWNSLPTNVTASTCLPFSRNNLKHFYLPNLSHHFNCFLIFLYHVLEAT